MSKSLIYALLLLFIPAIPVLAASAATFTSVEVDPSTGLSRAVVVPSSALVHTAQFLPVGPTGAIVGKDDAKAQTRPVLESVSTALTEAKTGFEQTVKICL